MVKLPAMRFPDAEADLVREQYAKARTILEYGSGGSTVVAARLPQKYIISVESDADWIAMLKKGLDAAGFASQVHFHLANIGPTGAWGSPLYASNFPKFPAYSLGIWDQPFFRQPDVVLIDGRARAACLLATLFRTAAPVTVLFDDYVVRPAYHVVERLVKPTRSVGRMAVFEISPTSISPADLTMVATVFATMMVDQTHIGRRLERFVKKTVRRIAGN